MVTGNDGDEGARAFECARAGDGGHAFDGSENADCAAQVEYMLVAAMVVGIHAGEAARQRGEPLDDVSVSVGVGTAVDFALHRPEWWARLVEARRVDTERASFAELDAVIDAVERGAMKRRTR